MKKVAVIGGGMTLFRRRLLETGKELSYLATKMAMEDAGVEKKDITLHGIENAITISVDTPQRKYYKEVKTPTKIEPKKAKSSYKNGALEITIPKKKEEKPKGETIEIE